MAGPIVSVVGGLNMDLIFETERVPDVGESMDCSTLSRFPGGKGANTAIATYRASHPKPTGDSNGSDSKGDIRVQMNGAVGDDDFGIILKTRLKEEGVGVSGIRTIDNERSGTCIVLVETDTGDSRNLAYQGANLKWAPRDRNSMECLADGAIPDLVIAHLGVRREEVERVLETAKRNGVETLLNPSPAVYLVNSTYKNLTHLVLNETEAAILSGRNVDEINDLVAWQEAVEDFIQLGVSNVVITLGAKGAYYGTSDGRKGLVDAEKNIKVIDTTGAGDTFVGNYAVEYMRQKQLGEWDIVKAIARACKASARTIERLGAQEAIPWSDEIDRE
ncbi:Ribokinase-like protein [Stachybotrys elegans]|uniref:Ribokinase n=1 Tax=Stachybotrys elegans TaxID=80388 RepID=A0A8K0SL93_9HYPO|nr:Ribokinase-like protein [Stachybotrys elegans]